ncbi:unnamed protein product [Tuber melanosporum]|uniref:(Perigord truffle) hypothetical protein n=1 Tax=Tuber melanosporum (strain Mel28) TaxID=656061 RepID=D5G9A3_TUBMM|nr:uncharacterized protein GSTUM_00003222001 [Tuber melanosporum]CAZ81096.1 unnamed protein product [Tuber melanosporum]
MLDPDAKSSPTFPLHRKKRRIDYWAWEWLAILVSFLAIVASTIVLLLFDDRAIPAWSWSSGGISVNAILSLLSTLSRASLLVPIDECMGQLMWLWFSKRERRLADVEVYNQASRGPLGALKLCWRQKGWGLGCLGALLMVCSMGLGVAQQQLLSYPNRSIIQPNSTSTVTRAERFDTYQNVTTSGTTTPEISFSLLSSIYNAALSGSSTGKFSTVNQPFFTCTSGNCEFPPFATLAVCSECFDVSDKVQSSCDADNLCTAEFGGMRAQSWQQPDNNNINTILNQTYLALGSSTMLNSGVASRSSPFSTLAHLQARSENGNWPPKYHGTECALFWCVKTVSAKVHKGVYAEEVISTNTDITNGTNGERSFSLTNGTQVTSFVITPLAQESIQGPKGVTNLLSGWAKGSGYSRVFSSDLMQGFSTQANVTEVMSRVATAMTNRVRDFDGLTPPVNGTTMAKQSFIRVRWPWLAFPVTLWVFSLIFLLTIVVKSREGETKWGMRAWGANSLALMFHGLDEDSRNRVREGEWEEMEDLSERLWVKLERGDEGLKLRARRIDE